MESFDGKVALITGGSKGIGYGIAEALLNMNMRVAITSRTEESAIEGAKRLTQIGKGKVLGLVADVRNYRSQEEAVNVVLDKWGQIDVLIANAGIGHFGSIEDLSVDQWRDTIDTNLSGVFYSIKAALPALKNK